MKIGLKFGCGTISWRAEDSDEDGILRIVRLRDSVGMDELPDDGTADCRIVPRDVLSRVESVGVPRHAMRMAFPDGAEGGVMATFCDAVSPPEAREINRWRGVRKLLYLGFIPRMLKGELEMVHGALLEHDGKALMLCGPSGIGKSTTALRMSARCRILADDCFMLERKDGSYLARPLPTWSSYLFNKERLATCDARRCIPVSRLLILGRQTARYTPLDPRSAMLGCANAFTDMVKWHTLRCPEPVVAALISRALDAARRIGEELPCGALQLTLDCDIFRLLPDFESDNA